MDLPVQDSIKPPKKGCLLVLLTLSILSILLGIFIINKEAKLQNTQPVIITTEP